MSHCAHLLYFFITRGIVSSQLLPQAGCCHWTRCPASQQMTRSRIVGRQIKQYILLVLFMFVFAQHLYTDAFLLQRLNWLVLRTWPLQSQGLLKSTYSPSADHMANALFKAFPWSSCSNFSFAILSNNFVR